MIDIDEIALETVKAIGNIDPDKLPGGTTQAIAQAQILVRDAIESQLSTTKAENEALRARLADAINCLDTVSGKAELGASVVRAERTEAMNHVAEGFDVIKRYAKTEANRLRQQAERPQPQKEDA